MRNIILSIIGVLLIVVSFFIAKQLIDNKTRPKPVIEKVVKTVYIDTVKNETVKIKIPANGSLVAKRRVELYAEVQGVFKSGNKLFKPGEHYRKGETLIRIDAAEYYASVQSAKSNLYNTIAAIMPDLRLDFPKMFQKWQTYLNSFDLNKTTPKLPEMSSDKENYFITGRGIVSSYYNVKNLEARLAKYNVRAPFNGIITEALVTNGTLVRAGQKMGEFIDDSVFELALSVNGSFADVLQKGKKVTLNNLEKTKTWNGKVTRINGKIDQATQTVQVFIEVKGKDVREGMYLEANVPVKTATEAIEIDRKLLVDNTSLYVVKNNQLDMVTVNPIHFNEKTVVVKGLENGEILVRKPVAGAYVGLPVTIFSETKNTSKK